MRHAARPLAHACPLCGHAVAHARAERAFPRITLSPPSLLAGLLRVRGPPPPHLSVCRFSGPREVVALALRRGGVTSLFQGIRPAFLREVSGYIGQFVAYEVGVRG